MHGKNKPYRVVGAFDTETTNIRDGMSYNAFPVLFQLGILDEAPIEEVFPQDVQNHVEMHLFRHVHEFNAFLDSYIECSRGYVPVIMCHNLSFDMYSLASWLNAHDVRVLAKSRQKPITFTIRGEDGKPCLVFWDTLVFSQQPLSKMGEDCGYPKANGLWDYDLVRTPETPLSDDEVTYATHDVYALIAWLGWWLRRNPDISPDMLGLNVVTKTGVVRKRRVQRFGQLKGQGLKYNVGRYWLYLNRLNLPKTDDELFTMHAATRGGFTFCASSAASVPFDLVGRDEVIAGFDATSQHPAQMVSHMYPHSFHETSAKALDSAFRLVGKRDFAYVCNHWEKPFNNAFHGLFRFKGLKPRPGSLFEKWGIYPLASARFSHTVVDSDEENEQGRMFDIHLESCGYKDSVVNPRFLFGKLVSADSCELFLTELAAWEMHQAYTWDSCIAVHGYMTSRFSKPSDMSVISVMQFYKAKNVFKAAREEYFKCGNVKEGDILRSVGIPERLVSDMECGKASDAEIDLAYLGLKADLNCTRFLESKHRTSSGKIPYSRLMALATRALSRLQMRLKIPRLSISSGKESSVGLGLHRSLSCN